MANNNGSLLNYKLEHFGKVYFFKPEKYAQIATNQYQILRLPYALYQKNTDFNNLHARTFYIETNDRYFNIPKQIPIIKTGNYYLCNSITPIKTEIFELCCIFPPDIDVPANCRMIKFYGKPEWFEKFESADNLVKKIALKIIEKKY